MLHLGEKNSRTCVIPAQEVNENIGAALYNRLKSWTKGNDRKYASVTRLLDEQMIAGSISRCTSRRKERSGEKTERSPWEREKFIEPAGRADDALKTSLRGCSDSSDAFARSRAPRWKSALSERVGEVLLKKTRRTLTKSFVHSRVERVGREKERERGKRTRCLARRIRSLETESKKGEIGKFFTPFATTRPASEWLNKRPSRWRRRQGG